MSAVIVLDNHVVAVTAVPRTVAAGDKYDASGRGKYAGTPPSADVDTVEAVKSLG